MATAPVDSAALFCGLAAGVAQAGLFNPIDRALYLSVTNRTRFLSAENWKSPYQGFLQSIGGRALSGGVYFPLEHFFMSMIREDSGAIDNFVAGTAAGLCNALIVNPVSAIKYKTWGRAVNRGMFKESFSMYAKGGLRPFLNGLAPTMWRDVFFGGTYTYLRLEFQWMGLPQEYHFVGNMVAASAATVVSGPFNLARNVQYSTKSQNEPMTIREVLRQLVRETQAKETLQEKWRHCQNRLRLGWGTARVSVGMAFGHFVYDECMNVYQWSQDHEIDPDQQRYHVILARQTTSKIE